MRGPTPWVVSYLASYEYRGPKLDRSTIPASQSMVADRRRVSVPMPRRMVRVVSSRGHGQPSMVFPSSTPPSSAGTPPLPLAGVRSAAPELKAQSAGGPLRFKRLPRMVGSGQFAIPGFGSTEG